ncbi:ROK family transcriptional regulator [Streptomyces hawaiiensis]|uniref:ROK family transcriptional regulator n=1 Tax=Streptomyces hawaiiensis TaxID=67305 RepID=A0A6G5R9R2_9ACTN|nr:ROK family transcriptional regulator [Streptomyces hawaiiensis]QCD54720.1 ROK family transcriptional regulator [Streptomyces hawaiiensis]
MPASPSTARAINDRLALRLLQQEGPLTAGQLKQLTGLSRPTVADLVERLTAARLIAVVGEAGEQRRGPNAKVYGIVADRAHLAALDVRTEGVAVVVADLVGRVLAEASVPIGADTGTGPAVEQAVTLVERVAKEAGADRLHTVGIGAPGLVDPSSGELRDSTGLPQWHRRFVATLQERLPEARVSVENETNLAALAEQRDGAARDRDTFVLLWLGHGTGAAVVLDGALRRGASGGTGEIGFLPVPGTSALPTSTDCEGGFHSLAASAAVVDLAAQYGVPAAGREAPVVGIVRAAAGVVREAVGRVSGTDLSRPADPVREGAAGAPQSGTSGTAAAFLDALADRIAVGVASVVAILDPGCVVLGGEVGQAGGADLAARVQDRIALMTPLSTEVRATTLGGGAVLRGALLTARDRAQEELFTPGGRGRPDGGQGPSSPPPGRSAGGADPGVDPRKD